MIGDPIHPVESPSDARSNAHARSRITTTTFLAALLLASALYAAGALRLDFFVADGRPGPGFFPRLIGIGLVVGCLYALATTWRRYGPDSLQESHRPATLVFGLSGALFILGLVVVGTWAAMALFLFGTLSVFNPEGRITNIALSIGMPAIFYVVFDLWLSVPLPEGIVFGLR